jgi:hypothetical protein
MPVTHTTAVRDGVANYVIDTQLGAGSKLVIYSGTPPANAQAALAGNAAIATITGITYGAATGGIKTITASTPDGNAVGGTASFYRQLKADNTAIMQGAVGTAAGPGVELVITTPTGNLVIAAGATVSLTGTYTAPP